jgi:hypothetical protein
MALPSGSLAVGREYIGAARHDSWSAALPEIDGACSGSAFTWIEKAGSETLSLPSLRLHLDRECWQ